MVRGSTVTLGETSVVSIGTSNVPARPWVLRDNTLVMTTFVFAEALAKLAFPDCVAVSAQVPTPPTVS